MLRSSAFACFASLVLGCAAGGDTGGFGGNSGNSGDTRSNGAGSSGPTGSLHSTSCISTSGTGTFVSAGGANSGGGGVGGASNAGGGGSSNAGGGSVGGATNAGGAGQGGSVSTSTSTNTGTSSGGSGGSPTTTLIYANDDTTLVTLDPTMPTLPVTTIGDFDCIDPNGANGKDTSMNDIAVNSLGQLWGVSAHAVHPLTIQGSTVHCGTQISINSTGSTDARFYALTFSPLGTLSASAEVLVAGNSAGELWSIDASGNIAQHGMFGPVPADDGHGHTYANAGKDWELSGDIVFLANSGDPVGFATVRDCPTPPSTTGCNTVNTLIEIDMTALKTAGTQSVMKSVRGQIVKAAGCTDSITNNNYGNMYGIATWDSTVYGFSRTGNLVDIALADGTACLHGNYPNLKFAGAGVTTVGAIIIPPGG